MGDLKNQLIESAIEQFNRFGYKKTSLDDIVRDLNISKGTIYNFFKNKEDLFIQATKVGTDRMFEYLRGQINQTSDVKENLISYTNKKMQYLRDHSSQRGGNIAVMIELYKFYIRLRIMTPEKSILREILRPLEKKKGDQKSAHEFELNLNLIHRITSRFEERWLRMDSKKAEKEIKALFDLLCDGLYH